MNNNRIRPLFSFSALLAFALVGTGGTYFIASHKTETHPIAPEPIKVNQVVTIPTVEVPPPAPLVLDEQVIKADKPKPIVTKRPTSTPKAKIAAAPKECNMVCEDSWQDSNIGGRYKRCECK